jgi:hypothetical protein
MQIKGDLNIDWHGRSFHYTKSYILGSGILINLTLSVRITRSQGPKFD